MTSKYTVTITNSRKEVRVYVVRDVIDAPEAAKHAMLDYHFSGAKGEVTEIKVQKGVF